MVADKYSYVYRQSVNDSGKTPFSCQLKKIHRNIEMQMYTAVVNRVIVLTYYFLY